MKAVVAGGDGFIGRHLVKALLEQGNEVRSVDVKALNDWYQRLPDVESRGDLTQGRRGQAVGKPPDRHLG